MTVVVLFVLSVVPVVAFVFVFFLWLGFLLVFFPIIVVFPLALCATVRSAPFNSAIRLIIATVASVVVTTDSFVPVVSSYSPSQISNSGKRICIAQCECVCACTRECVCGCRSAAYSPD